MDRGRKEDSASAFHFTAILISHTRLKNITAISSVNAESFVYLGARPPS